ncbi:hypothetical protein NOVO_04515 [Rickettsiales bacterium Ac37b]|nr:hypothetical protein NOVO_04515 [Rickettsiales bacterium Ac37b]
MVFKFFSSNKTHEDKPKGNNDVEDIVPRPPPKIQRISVKESWNFLVNIIVEVKNKFSKKELAMVLQLGKALSNLGVKYQHVVEYSKLPFDNQPVRDQGVKDKPSKTTDDKRGR